MNQRGDTMRGHVRVVLPVAAFLWLLGGSTASADAVGDKVVKFCKDNLKKKVGEGECAHLAIEALKAAGAKADYTDSPQKEDYVWGKLVFVREIKERKASERNVDGMKVQPGDVIQFRGAKFRGGTGKQTYYAEAPHHTAIVIGLKDKGRTLVILHQNANGKKVVVEDSYRLDDLREGWLRVYRPQAK